jgi:AraC-like DNA-binding protein
MGCSHIMDWDMAVAPMERPDLPRFRPDELLGTDLGLRRVWNSLQVVARTDPLALIRGDTGMGKKIVGRAIHEESLHMLRPLVTLDCAPMPGGVLGSDLVPQEEAASTDATVPISRRAQIPRRSPCGRQRNRLLQQALYRMQADLGTDLDLWTLAAESGCSRSCFMRRFRAAMGCSPHQSLPGLPVEQAMTILRDHSISQIDTVLECGLCTYAHLSGMFLKIVGVTPRDYRRIHKVAGRIVTP